MTDLLALHNTSSLRYFMNEAYNSLPIPQDTLPAYMEILTALDDESYHGYSGITVSKEAFGIVASYIGTASEIRMKLVTQGVRYTMRFSPEEVVRLSIESPKLYEAYTQEIAQIQQEFEDALKFKTRLTKQAQQKVPTVQSTRTR